LNGIIEKPSWRSTHPEDTVIVLPSSDTLFPLLHYSLSRFEPSDYNISTGYPLHRTPLYAFFSNLMELISSMEGEKVFIPDYLRFVLHPYTKNIYFTGKGSHEEGGFSGRRSDITRIIFHTIEEELSEKGTKTYLPLTWIEEKEGLLASMAGIPGTDDLGIGISEISEHIKTIHRHTIRKLLGIKDTGDFAGRAIEILTYIFENSTASMHPFFHPFAETFIDSLSSLISSPFSNIVFREVTGYFNFLKRYIMSCYTPFEGTPVRGLQVLGLLETRNIRFRKVIVLDVNEGKIPNIRIEDTLLPLKAREILGLPTYRDRERLQAYYFNLLVTGAEEVHLFYIENEREEKSRFIEQLLWEKQKKIHDEPGVEKTEHRNKDNLLDEDRYIGSIQYRIDLKNRDPLVIEKTEGMISFLRSYIYSATSLDDYLRCPLRFYYRHVLNLKSRNLLSGEIERAEIGSLVHRILSRYFRRKKGMILRENDLSVREMEDIIDRTFREVYGTEIAGAAYLLRRQIGIRMKDLLQNYFVPLTRETPVIIMKTEYNIEGRLNSFRVKGRVDRIEQRGESIYIVDYKTGGNKKTLAINYNKLVPGERETWTESIGSLQLPFYMMLYSELDPDSKPISSINGIFLMIGRSRIDRDIEHPLFDPSMESEEGYRMLKDIIYGLLNEIINPDQPFEPASDRKTNCPVCDFRFICGTQWIQKTVF
jgi:CRISPR/Cas system-associated exonuclease Cas4 (RecB family)